MGNGWRIGNVRIVQWFLNLKRRYQIVLIMVALFLLWYLFALPSPLFNSTYSTVVVDRDGVLMGARIADDQQWRFPPTDSLPEKYKIALVQFEDRHFWIHPGVNPVSMFRALVQNVRNGKIVSGGSTITMQVIRMMRDNRRTYFEKFVESILATRLELSYSKEKILALYASHAPMGGNVVGIEAASWRFFGHSSSMLSWAEAATLAVLPNSPSLVHFGRDREVLLKKRNLLLLKLRDKERITETDYQLALEEPLPDKPHPLPQIAPHLVARISTLDKGKYIRTTIDAKLQKRAEEVLNRWYSEFSQNGINNIAAMIVDVESNNVMSYCGNINFESDRSSNQVDIIQSVRSTGSILKPFLYAAAIQEGSLLPQELLPDVPVSIGGFAPRNFSLQYDGAVGADEALARSLNVPFVILLKRYGVQKFYNLLQNAGITTLNRNADNYGLSLILGGAEATLWDLSSVYSAMARRLLYYGNKSFRENFLSFRIDDRGDDKDIALPFSAGAIWLTFRALTNVNRPEEIDWRYVPSMRKVAWKTGTSYGFRDGWSIGITPKYLVSVWVGNSSGEGRPGLTGAGTAGRVMFDLFNILPHTGWFEAPFGDLVEADVCIESGELAGHDCPESSLGKALIPAKGLNGSVCKYHKIVHLSEDMRYRVFIECAGKRGMITSSWFVLPPSWEWYYKERHSSYRSLPPYSPECLDGGGAKDMEFIYPFPNSIVKIPRQLDGSMGRVVFEVTHRSREATLFWHLVNTGSGENIYLGETCDIHKMDVSVSPGVYQLSVVDDAGSILSMKITIE